MHMAIVMRKSEDEQTAVSHTAVSRWQAIRAVRWFWLPVILFTTTRLGILLVAYLAVGLVADASTPPPYHLRGLDNRLLDVLGSRWDKRIGQSGTGLSFRRHFLARPSTRNRSFSCV